MIQIFSFIIIFFHLFSLNSAENLGMTIEEQNIRLFNGDPEIQRERRLELDLIRQERMRVQGNILTKKGKFSTFLFSRKYRSEAKKQDMSLSKVTFDVINLKRPGIIYFDEKKITPFDYKGTCSAMALDFLTRCLDFNLLDYDLKSKRTMIKSFGVYYRFENTTFISKQAAYNTISMKQPKLQLDGDDAKTLKMQSLANYHHLQLKPVTPSVSINSLTKKRYPLEKVINDLPAGVYAIRALAPITNHKMESYGHTMVLVKSADFSVFYDNNKGAAEIHTDVGQYVTDELIVWKIPEVRIYHAISIGEDDCNLSAEQCEY